MSILVVGGGITGLTTAHTLARDGHGVILVEAASRLGGKVRTEHVDGYVVEAGPDSVVATRPAAIKLARELGLGAELIGVREPRGIFVRHRGRLVPMPDGLGLVLPTRVRPFATSPLFSWPEKVRMALDAVLPRNLPAHDLAVGEYLRSRLGDPLVDRLAGPLVGGIYGTPIDELSLDAVVPTLRDADRDHRSLLFAGLAQGRAARRARVSQVGLDGGSGRPAAKGGSPGSLGMFVSLAPGMGRLTDALAARLAADPAVALAVGVQVDRLERRPGGLRARLSDGRQLDADAVVVTTPAPAAAVIVNEVAPGLPRLLGAIPHGSTAVVTLGYPRSAFEEPPSGHGFIVARGEDLAISACTISSGKWPGRAPDERVLLRAFVPDGADLARPDADLVALARRDIHATLGVHGQPELVRVARWSAAMPRYTVGHLERVAAIEDAAAAVPGLVLAGAPYRGVGIPDCVAQGRAAAARVAALVEGEVAAA